MANDTTRHAMSARALRLGQVQTFDIHVARLIAVFEDVAASRSRRSPHSRPRGSKSPALPHREHGRKTGANN
jgi:UDP-glucose:(heptosyl)LPS alpha-1,3-glucosyltransferase